MESRIIERLDQLIRPEIRAIQAYQAEDQGPAIRLDANESPFDVPEFIKNEVLEIIKKESWQRYPDPENRLLRKAISDFENIEPDRITVGNGSDELIRDIMTVFGGPGTRTVFPSPTFSMYRLLTIASGGTPVGVRLLEDWSMDMEGMQAEVGAENTRLVFIANPNNPTGKAYNKNELEQIIESAKGLVVIDEAYRLFSDYSLREIIDRYPNVVIMHTFSKSFSLAGIRLGYMIGHPLLIDAVNRIRLPYNIDRFAQLTARIVLEHKDYWLTQAQTVKRERKKMADFLKQYASIKVYDSQANFILIRHESSEKLKSDLQKADISVRGFSHSDGLGNCLRITIGSPEENLKLMETVKKTMQDDTRGE